MLAEVAIPVEQRNLADNEQLLLVTAEPAAMRSGASCPAPSRQRRAARVGGALSFFQPVVVRDLVVPALVTSIDGKNNNGFTTAPPSCRPTMRSRAT